MKAIALSMDVSALQGRLGKVLRAHRSLFAVIFVYFGGGAFGGAVLRRDGEHRFHDVHLPGPGDDLGGSAVL